MPRNAWLTPEQIPANRVSRVLCIPDEEEIIAAVTGALVLLSEPDNWEQYGSVTPEDIASSMFDMLRAFIDDRWVCMVGVVIPYAGDGVPDGFLLCDGASYLVEEWPLLYEVIGTRFGGVPGTSFNVPDLRGVVVAGVSDGGDIGDEWGEASHVLSVSEMPMHSHVSHTHLSGVALAPGELPVALPMTPGVTGDAGAGLAHENRPPTMALGYLIRAR